MSIVSSNWTLFYSKENSLDFTKMNKITNVSVPTTFEMEIFKSGILGHPYYSTNNWSYQKYEDYHQYYCANFNYHKKNAYIIFDGIDTIADIYVNGVLIGQTNNCFISYAFPLTNLKQKDNKIVVHIYPSVTLGLAHDFNQIRQVAKYNYESLYIRKPASSFGWDILPRTPLGGIYKDVKIIDKLPIIEDVQIAANNISSSFAELNFSISSKDKDVLYLVHGECEDSVFDYCTSDSSFTIFLNNPKLWTIRGYGKQNLYKISVSVIKNKKIIAKKIFKYGIRKVQLLRTSTVTENGKFEFLINEQKVFIFGSNWVPVEALKHVDLKRAKKTLDMLLDLGCNAIRIWGGGTYELDEFYSLCDKEGIFIWQDFMMGCATYPQDNEFQKQLKEEAEYIVKKLRNHCSICLWAGDNENDCASAFWAIKKDDPNKNVLTRVILPNVIKELDNTRPYLPSSPFIDSYAYSHQNEPVSEDHCWGPRDYFKGDYYKNAYPYFVSETGYHGLNSVCSLKKFMHKPWPLFDKKGNPTKEYLCHGVSVKDDLDSPYAYRTKLMADQVSTLFINKFKRLSDFVLASQISQAEAMKYFIEKMRRDTNRNGGIIWWNILDGWPQVSDAVVDYYFAKKLAYYYIKKSQQPLLLFIDENDNDEILYCSSLFNNDDDINYSIIDAYNGEKILTGSCHVNKNASAQISSFKNDHKQHFLLIEYETSDGQKYMNSFHTNVINIDFYRYKNVLLRYNYFK